MMSDDNLDQSTADNICCANCGIAEVDDITLEECGDCQSVRYCSDKCREEHREPHEEECKKRKALLHDRQLFTQPDETHLGECPLCFLPLPIDKSKSIFYTCCSETICNGCVYANYKSNKNDRMKALRCPFCREVADDKENDKRLKKRIKAKDPAALTQIGIRRHQEGDYDKAIESWTKAAELGDADAHYSLGSRYHFGQGVDKDLEKVIYHWEKAAIGGHPWARYNLAAFEEENGNMERAVKHFIINANLGCEKAMKELWRHYAKGNITKEDLDATLRTHHAAINEMKSPEREAAEAWRERQRVARRRN